MKYSWKIAAILLLIYTSVGGLLMDVPRLAILNETIRSLYFHVPMWFTMVVMFLISTVYALKYLSSSSTKHDVLSVEFANTGIMFGILGIITGMIWAKYTWGSPWHGDPKQNGAAVSLLIYLTYFVLRASVANQQQKAKLSAVYNIFAFASMIPLIFILPRMTSSIHPGSGGNPAFNIYDLNNTMRIVFYPAVVGWILTGLWIASLRCRIRIVKEKILDYEEHAIL